MDKKTIKNIKKILIVRPDAIGDVVLTFPIVHELKQAYPNCEIYYLASDYTRPLLENHEYIAGVIKDELNKGKDLKKFLEQYKTIKKQNFDVIFHCYNEFPYALLALLARIPVRIGDSSKVIPKFFHNKRINQGYRNLLNHEVDLNLKYLKPLGLEIPTKPILKYPIKDKLKVKHTLVEYSMRQKVVIHPGSGGGNQPWSKENYKKFIDYLSRHGYLIILTGSSKESTLTYEISSGSNNVIDVAGKTSIQELVGILSDADYFISVDTGPMHLAAAMDVPILLISPTHYVKPNRWGPYESINKVIGIKRTFYKNLLPNKNTRSFFVESISIENVISAFNELSMKTKNSIFESKKEWLKTSLNILDLRDKNSDKEFEDYNYYAKREVRKGLISFIKNKDINVFLVDKRSFKLWLIRNIVAITIYCPPIQLILDENNSDFVEKVIKEFAKYD